jgi:hypothetical protein
MRRVQDGLDAIEELGNYAEWEKALNEPAAPYTTLEEFAALSWFIEYTGTNLENMDAFARVRRADEARE